MPLLLTLKMPASPYDVIKPYFIFPSETDTSKSVPLGRCQLLPITKLYSVGMLPHKEMPLFISQHIVQI